MNDPRFGSPAPVWFQQADVFNGWYGKWSDDVLGQRLRGFPFIVGVPHSKEWVEKAHQRGIRVLPYVSFYKAMDLSSRKEEEASAPLAAGGGSPSSFSPFWKAVDIGAHPEWILVKENGEPRRPFEEPGWPASYGEGYPAGWEQVCPNAPGYQDAALHGVEGLLELAVDGLFLDNVHPQHSECFGPQTGRHQHVQPDKTREQTYLELLARTYDRLKQWDPEQVIILNGKTDPEYLRYADGAMTESYICSSEWDHRQSWENVRGIAESLREPLAHGKVITPLSYLGHTAYPVEEDAFYCYACARLSGFIWADWFTLPKSSPAQVLFKVRLGRATSPPEQDDGTFFRLFERGLVAVNPGPEARKLRAPWTEGDLIDLFDQVQVSTVDGFLKCEIPPESGRVYSQDGVSTPRVSVQPSAATGP